VVDQRDGDVTPPEAEEPVLPVVPELLLVPAEPPVPLEVLPLPEGRVDVEPPEEPMPERVLEDDVPPEPVLGDEADDEPEGP